MRSDILQLDEPQVCRPGNGIANSGDRGNAAAGTNIAFDEIHRSFVAIKNLIADDDGLQRHRAVSFQQSAARLKEGRVKMMADSLDHFDGE